MTLDLSRWPDGLAPVRTLLDPDSARALNGEPSAHNRVLRLAAGLDEEALCDSVLIRNALMLLEETRGEQDMMWISSSSGCLMMKCVSKLRSVIGWPGLEATEQMRRGKTYREQAVKELHLLRLLVQGAGLIRAGGPWFELTPLGERMLEPDRRGELQARLFHHAFWRVDLSRFLPVYFPGKLPGRWPQGDIGVILWGLSAVAQRWQSTATLTALCAVGEASQPRSNLASTMFAWRVLWPLRWFGLLESRGRDGMFDVGWRKSALFDRFLSFDVAVKDDHRAGSGH